VGVDKDMLLLLKSAWLGDGEPDLGERLIKSFLTVLLESGTVPARIVCVNSGIFLSTEDSPVEDQLKQFVELGASVASCTTCLDYYKRRDKLVVGTATDMRDIVGAMLGHSKVLMP
jgi:selenium metabolism protein YedF